MKRITDHFERKLADIRVSDETTKTVWLYGLTTVASLIVIGLWLGYQQYTLPTVAAPVGAPQLAARTAPAAPGITDTFRVGAETITASLGVRFTRGLALLKNAFLGSGNVVSVTGAERNFIPEGLAPLEHGALPK